MSLLPARAGWVATLLCFGCAGTALVIGAGPAPAAPDDAASMKSRSMLAAPSVIPVPASFSTATGSFTVSARTPIAASRGEVEQVARYFTDLVSRTRGIQLGVRTAEVGRDASAVRTDGRIEFQLDPQAAAGEAYVLDISPRGVRVQAREARGLFYGAVTLWALMTADPNAPSSSSATLTSMRIVDAPRFAWRGFMLDSARHYQPPAFIKQMLDWMALHKLNTFHWHLTDDQAWRLQIRKYPRLTEVGAWRVPAGAAPAADIDSTTGRPRLYGGYYTQDEVREIVRYASERFITVVPEIEMPGHAQATLAAYPALGTDAVAPPVSSDWGVHSYLYNVDEATFGFLEDVLTEVMALFPGQYIHVGGDEAVKDRWRASTAVQQRMRELGVANETALQSYFTHRMERFLSSHGRKLIGWDEILEGGLPQSAAVMSWRGTDGAVEATRQGHDVVMSPAPSLYLDYLQSDLADEPSGRPSLITLQDMYSFNVVSDAVSADAARHILGAQINAWTEHMRAPERVEHAAFPRMAAFAEVVWSPGAGLTQLSSSERSASALGAEAAPAAQSTQRGQSRSASASYHRTWQDFLRRMPAQFARYQTLGIHYADSAFAVKLSPSDRLELSNQVNTGEIRYTLNGKEPTRTSTLYTTPVSVTRSATAKAATFINGYRMSTPRERTFDRATALRRNDDELPSCSKKLPLRLEDDAPVAGPRVIFNVDILDPCWIWPKADLSRITAIAASVGQVPFNFQVGEAVKAIPLVSPASPAGELEVRLDSCDGERIAVLSLEPATENQAVTSLPRASFSHGSRGSPIAGRHDLCLRFTRRSIDPIWALKSVQLFE